MNDAVVLFVKALGIGLSTGLLSGAFGIGGGIICTPLLSLVVGLPPHTAVGTTMAVIIPTAVSGLLNYVQERMVDVSLAKTMFVPAAVGVLCGAWLTTLVKPQLLMILFSMLVFLSGLDMIRVSRKKTNASDELLSESKSNRSLSTAISIGFGAGLLAGFFGVGGGFILVPCFSYFWRMPIKRAFGTSLCLVAVISVPGALMHWWFKHIELDIAILVALAAMPGSWLGSALALKLKDSWLKAAFGAIMLMIALILAAKELGFRWENIR